MAFTPLQCFKKAVENEVKFIVIIFPNRSLSLNEQIVELCKILTSSPLTENKIVFGIMERPNRKLALKLQKAGMDYIKIQPVDKYIDPFNLVSEVREEQAIGLRKFLETLCPFLSYKPVDNQAEMITCRAYKNWLVLGGKRLHDICETKDHTRCEYFLNPRIKHDVSK
ncbi:MAG: hypothetical protein R6U50_01320 [Desulfobacterales bacterium]